MYFIFSVLVILSMFFTVIHLLEWVERPRPNCISTYTEERT